MKDRKTVTLVTGHYYESKRKAGFHWIANEFYKKGWKVVFLTAPISYFSKLKGDYRFAFNIEKEKNKLIQIKENLYSYVYFTMWHPANLRNNYLNKCTSKLFSYYGNKINYELKEIVKQTDLFIFESTPALLLFKTFKNLNSKAKFIYRVSDDLKLLNVHPYIITFENENYTKFDLVSVPCEYIYNKFKIKEKVRLQYHGIDTRYFDDEKIVSPFKPKTINAVFVGNSHFDYEFLDIASKEFSQIYFHIIGPLEKKIQKENIIYYGEMAFADTVKYIKFADIGLANRSYFKGAESLTDSLKILQYSYCNIPYVAPEFLKSRRENGFFYLTGDKRTMIEAVQKALLYKNTNIKSKNNIVNTWEEFVHDMCNAIGIE
jgi:2-beta-glucuronyltransferase